MVSETGECAMQRIDQHESEKGECHPAQQRFPGGPVTAPRYVGDKKTFQRRDRDHEFVEWMILEFKGGVLKEKQIGDQKGGRKRKTGDERAGINSGRKPDNPAWFVGNDDGSAHLPLPFCT